MSLGIGRIVQLLLSVQLALTGQVVAETSSEKNWVTPERLSKGNVLFHYFQDNPEGASRAALYAERLNASNGDSDSETFTHKFPLMRAGLALDMGNENQAAQILKQLSPEQLSSRDKARWHFQLARNAYRRQDWESLKQEISKIPEDSKLMGSTRLLYLQAELHCLQGEFATAAKFVSRIEPTNVLGRYARFNLGLSAYRQGHMNIAEAQLVGLVDSKVYSHEELMLSDRARLVLANIRLESGEANEALTLLRSVTSTEEYGPEAIANIISLALGGKDYKRAADYSRYLIDTVPWHPAARDAHVGLPYALEQIHGSNRALGEYQQSAERLHKRSDELDRLLETLDVSAAAELVSLALSFEDATKSTNDLVYMDWATWISSTRGQSLAQSWKSLNGYVASLKQHRRDLAGLLEIDAEQKRRNRVAAEAMANEGHQDQLLFLQKTAGSIYQTLEELLARDDRQLNHLLQLATESEYRDFQYLSTLRSRAEYAGADSKMMERIARLEGVLFYTIQNELPVRVQRHRTRTDELLASLQQLQASSQRIKLASDNAEIHDHFSNRIAALDARVNGLIAQTEITLEATGEALIAIVADSVREELAGLDEQLVYLRLAMARIGDEQNMLAGGGR